ncbi:hypothetical protein ACA910_000253 [Epithemia clementina (nom. ined.)]
MNAASSVITTNVAAAAAAASNSSETEALSSSSSPRRKVDCRTIVVAQEDDHHEDEDAAYMMALSGVLSKHVDDLSGETSKTSSSSRSSLQQSFDDEDDNHTINAAPKVVLVVDEHENEKHDDEHDGGEEEAENPANISSSKHSESVNVGILTEEDEMDGDWIFRDEEDDEDDNYNNHNRRTSFDGRPEVVARAIDRALEQERRRFQRTRARTTSSRHNNNINNITTSSTSTENYIFCDDHHVNQNHSIRGWSWRSFGTSAAARHQRMVVHSTRPGAIQELCDNLRFYPDQGLTRPELLQKLVDFHRARYQRRKQQDSPYTKPWGLMGLFLFVGEVRVDLQWTEDAAWRRANHQPPIAYQSFAKFHSPEFRQSYFVYWMELVSIIMMTIAMWKNDWKFAPLNENPMLGPSAQVLLDLGALNSEAVVQDHEWYRLIAPMVLHAGLIHLLINSLALHFIGGPIERALGSTLTAGIFFMSGLGGNIASALFIQNTVSVGASGGLFGLLGLCLANILTNWDVIALRNFRDPNDPAFRGFPRVTVALVLVTEMLVNLIVGLTPYIDNFAHLGGLLYGILFGFPMLSFLDVSGFSLRKFHSQWRHIFFTSRALSFIIGAMLFTLTSLSLANYDGNEALCKNCKYVSCAPFPFWTNDPWWYCDNCDKTHASWTVYFNYTIITMTCPYGGEVIREFAGQMTGDDVMGKLTGLCRSYCSV